MVKIPFLTIFFALIVCVFSFRVPHANENPDLFIDDELNLVEPKLDFWNVFLRPKTKTSFKHIVKMLNNYDSRDKYVVGNTQPIAHFEVGSEGVNKNAKVDDTQILIQAGNPGIVSEEVVDKTSLSEEHSQQVGGGSVESKSDSSEDSQSKEFNDESNATSEAQSKDKAQISKSEEVLSAFIEPTRSSDTLPEKPMIQEPIRYEASLPKSLHYFEIDRPRYQHSIRDGWIY